MPTVSRVEEHSSLAVFAMLVGALCAWPECSSVVSVGGRVRRDQLGGRAAVLQAGTGGRSGKLFATTLLSPRLTSSLRVLPQSASYAVTQLDADLRQGEESIAGVGATALPW